MTAPRLQHGFWWKVYPNLFSYICPHESTPETFFFFLNKWLRCTPLAVLLFSSKQTQRLGFIFSHWLHGDTEHNKYPSRDFGTPTSAPQAINQVFKSPWISQGAWYVHQWNSFKKRRVSFNNSWPQKQLPVHNIMKYSAWASFVY